jgi:transposase
MIQVSSQTRVVVAIEPVDFRKGIDGLVRQCREYLEGDPFSGTVFVFRNGRGHSVKLLFYDGRGFWLCQKRLSAGKFRHWPGGASGVSQELEAHELSVLLAGGDPQGARGSRIWRRAA